MSKLVRVSRLSFFSGLIVLKDNYPVLCNVTADTQEAARSLVLQRRPDGKSYFSFSFSIILLLGQTEMKAQIAWVENVSAIISDTHAW